MSYGRRQPAPPPPKPYQPCAIGGCEEFALDVYETRLCVLHGTEANVARDRAGLAFVPWDEIVKWVGNWVERRNLRKAEGA